MELRSSLHRLMFGLLYPAVLGTIFVLFISEDLPRLPTPRMLFGAVFLFHWCIEFMLATAPAAYRQYVPTQFVGDFGLVCAMYAAFAALPTSDSLPAGSYGAFYVTVGVIAVVFLATDLLNFVFYRIRPTTCLVRVDSGLLVVAAVFTVVAASEDGLGRSVALAYFFIVVTLAASLGSLWCRRGEHRAVSADMGARDSFVQEAWVAG